MKTVRKLIYRDVLWSVFFVALAFLALFFFIDFLDELGRVGRDGYTLGRAMLSAALSMPGRLYELGPIAVLIGTIYAMARLAQSSEYTILRTAGLGPERALTLLLVLGLVLGVFTFVVGEYIAPLSEQQASALRSKQRGTSVWNSKAGAWLKEHRETPEGERNYSINVRRAEAHEVMRDIRIFEHDANGQLLSRIEADKATAGKGPHGAVWHLEKVQITDWPPTFDRPLTVKELPTLDWATTLDTGLVSAAISPIDSMSTVELWRYSRHLSDQAQTSQRYELQFWKRVFYPFACIVMVALALPFAYLHARSGGISLKVFGGIMLGISFVLLNNVVGHLGLLHAWTPWLASSVPSLIYLGLSLAAFWWLVRYR
ncbi:LPS export ABC transporter permease LptG [Ideonella sp. B7]|uniref:LPS export ABC transporter permease LptG n=1 Tax=Ideonella benzenivorans TaxID=2831643 RepID=UPI001CEC6445|nr:LPS export ABC transporter permease LptG [Ideonella benzenivorans]MCA6216445.1 LPS export ABC transporter permease LptG [Ideonella benzenivorans]